MREVRIVDREKVQEFRSLEELLDTEFNLGIMIKNRKYILTRDDATMWGYAVSANEVVSRSDIQDELVKDHVRFRFFVFDSTKELYLWLADGEK